MDPNISTTLQLVERYGLSIVISVVLIFACLKLIKIFVKNNIKALDDAKVERQEITKQFMVATERFNKTLNKHLDDNTQMQSRLVVSVDGLAQKCSDGFGEVKNLIKKKPTRKKKKT